MDLPYFPDATPGMEWFKVKQHPDGEATGLVPANILQLLKPPMTPPVPAGELGPPPSVVAPAPAAVEQERIAAEEQAAAKAAEEEAARVAAAAEAATKAAAEEAERKAAAEEAERKAAEERRRIAAEEEAARLAEEKRREEERLAEEKRLEQQRKEAEEAARVKAEEEAKAAKAEELRKIEEGGDAYNEKSNWQKAVYDDLVVYSYQEGATKKRQLEPPAEGVKGITEIGIKAADKFVKTYQELSQQQMEKQREEEDAARAKEKAAVELPPPPLRTAPLLRAQAAWAFTPTGAGQVAVSAGEVVEVVQQVSEHWILARNKAGETGHVPAAYVKMLPPEPVAPAPPPPTEVRAADTSSARLLSAAESRVDGLLQQLEQDEKKTPEPQPEPVTQTATEQEEQDEQKEEEKEPEPAAWMPPVEDDWMAARRRKVAQRRAEEEEQQREQSGAGSQAWQAQVERAQEGQDAGALQRTSTTDLRQLFSVIDVDSSGDVSKDNIRQFMSDAGEELSEAEIEQMFANADVSSDGSVKFEEFQIVINRYEAETSSLKALFDVMDGSQTGSLSRDDLREFLIANGEAPEMVEPMFNDADLDGDGVVSFEEFAKMVRGQLGAPAPATGWGQQTELDVLNQLLEHPQMTAEMRADLTVRRDALQTSDPEAGQLESVSRHGCCLLPVACCGQKPCAENNGFAGAAGEGRAG